MIQLDLLTPLETMVGAFLFFLGGALIGLYLAWLRGIFILYLGIFGFLSGVFCSWPRLNWDERGFGEILVGINFGVLMTLGAYYIQTRQVDLAPIIASIPIAFLITAVLYINEFPDFHADREGGRKRSSLDWEGKGQ